MTNIEILDAAIREAEGTGPMRNGRMLPYVDCCGRPYRLCTCATPGTLTIGHGTNLDIGITEREDDALYLSRRKAAEADLLRLYPWMIVLDQVRYASLLELHFNMGGPAFAGFVLMLQAVRTGDWMEAGRQLADSDWWTQVGRRGPRIRAQLETGRWA